MFILSQDKTRIFNTSGHIEGIGYKEENFKEGKKEEIRHTIQVFGGCAEEIAEYKCKEDCLLVLYAIFNAIEQGGKTAELPTQEEMKEQREALKGASATSITVSGNVLDPSMITKTDIIGAYNASTGKESGLEVVRQVYPKLGVVPGLIVAPGWSQIPEVGIAMSAKAANINGVFKAVALVDLDTTKATKYTDCKKTKEDSGFTSAFCYPTWPCVKVGDYVFAMSAVVAALIAYTDASNDDVPSLSPSNEMLGVTGTCLADGTEVTLDQDQGSTVNTYGVATAINMNGWKLWGNYTGAFPSSGDTKDIWLAVRRMFNWHGNNFIQTYFEKVDDPMNHVLIESIIDSENIRCAAYAPDKWAGAEMQYLASDNPITDTLAGKITFRQRIAPYTPAQEIDNILSYDTDMLKNALSGGGE